MNEFNMKLNVFVRKACFLKSLLSVFFAVSCNGRDSDSLMVGISYTQVQESHPQEDNTSLKRVAFGGVEWADGVFVT